MPREIRTEADLNPAAMAALEQARFQRDNIERLAELRAKTTRTAKETQEMLDLLADLVAG